MISQADLKKLLDYDPETGVFTWKVRVGQRARIGSRAGYVGKKGHRYIRIGYRAYPEHRLAFLFMTGETPDIVDHINNGPADNRWCNLRAADASQNRFNQKCRSDSLTGAKNVRLLRDGRYVVQVCAYGRTYGKYCDDIDSAKAHAEELREKLHGEYARAE